MQQISVATYEDGMVWLHAAGLEYYGTVPDNECNVARFWIPKDAGQMTAVARLLVSAVLEGRTIGVMIDEDGIWPSSENRLLFSTYRDAISEPSSIEEFPFQSSKPAAEEYMLGIVTLCLYFSWGITLLDQEGEIYIKISHDEWLEIKTRSIETFNKCMESINWYGLDPYAGFKVVRSDS